MEKKNIVGVLGLISIILVAISFGSGWYSINERTSSDYGTDYTSLDMYLGNMAVRTEYGSETIYYNDYPTTNGAYFVGTFHNIQILLGLSILALIGVMGAAFFTKKNDWLKWMVAISAILLLIIPIYTAISLPNAFARDNIWEGNSPATSFIGSYSETNYDYYYGHYSDIAHWGPGIAYFLVIFSFLLMLGSAILMGKKEQQKTIT